MFGRVLVGARSVLDVLDELVDDGFAHGLAVRDEPWAQSGANFCGSGRLAQDTLLLTHVQLGFGIVQELDGQAIARVDVRDVDHEASFRVLGA